MTTTARKRSDDALEVRHARESDLPDILALMRASLGEGKIPRHEAFWRWKHEQNPFGRSPVLLALDDGKLVGLRTFLRWTWTHGDDVLPAARAVDTATHPAFQGRGIFRTLTMALVEQMRDEGVAFIYNTPNEKSRPGYLKMGWSDVGKVPLWLRANHPVRTAARLATRGALDVDALHAGDFRAAASLDALLGDARLSSLLQPRRSAHYATPKSPAFLRWRYRDVPGFTYGAQTSWGARGGAAVIYRVRERSGFTEATVVEVLSSPGVAGAGHAVRALRGLASALDVDYTLAAAPSGAHDVAALAAAGFVPVGARGLAVTVRPLRALPRDAREPQHWRWSVGDFELF